MRICHRIGLTIALASAACSSTRPATPSQSYPTDARAAYLRELNAAHPADPVLDGGDPAIKARIVAPVETRRIQPAPPASGRRPPAEGKAFLGGVIERDGSVSHIRILAPSGNSDFDASSVEAVRQWRYTPATLDGSPVRLYLDVSTSFRFR